MSLDEQKRRNYDMHGSEEGFSMGGQDINPEEIFRMFFGGGGGGGDPFSQFFGSNQGFTVYSNFGGTQGMRMGGHNANRRQQQQRQRQPQDIFGGGANIFDILGGLNNPRQRRPAQRTNVNEQQQQDDDPLSAYFQKRQQRGQNNRAAQGQELTPEKLLLS